MYYIHNQFPLYFEICYKMTPYKLFLDGYVVLYKLKYL